MSATVISSAQNLIVAASLSRSLTPECKDVVMADFGIAKHYHPGEELTSLAGSPGYAGEC